jgi:hypothetical protein
MKSVFGLIFLFFLKSIDSNAQFDKRLFTSTWKVGQLIKTHGHEIIKIENHDENGEYTNISFSSKKDMIDNLKSKSEKEMWVNGELEKRISDMNFVSINGSITLYVGRLTLESADTKFFTLIIKSKEGVEIFRNEFKTEMPEPPEGDEIWWNNSAQVLHHIQPISYPIDIFIIDKLSENPKSHFRILN